MLKIPSNSLHGGRTRLSLAHRPRLVPVDQKALQFNVQSGYGEDGAEMQKAFAGTPSVNLTVPTRYMHTHYGVINRNDFDGLVELLTAVIYELTPAKVKEVQRF